MRTASKPYLCALIMCSLTACSINAPGVVRDSIASEVVHRYAERPVLQENQNELGRLFSGCPIVACREALTSAQPIDDAHP